MKNFNSNIVMQEIKDGSLGSGDFGGGSIQLENFLGGDTDVIGGNPASTDIIPSKEEIEKPIDDEKVVNDNELDNEPDDESDNSDEPIELTKEQIEAKVKEISEKEEKTDEDKEFLKQHSNKRTIERLVDHYDGLKFDDLNLEEIPNNFEGLVQVADKISEKKAGIVAQEYISNFLEQNPVIKEIHDYVRQGNSINTYLESKQSSDFEKFDIKNELGQVQMLKYDLSQKGLSADEQDLIIENYKASNKLEQKSKEAFDLNKSKKSEQIKAKEQQEQEQIRLQQQQALEEQKQVKTLLSKKKILDTNLSDAEVQKFSQFISVDKNGKIPAEEAWNNATVEQKMFIDLLLLRGFKSGKPINNLVDDLDSEFLNRSNKVTASNKNTGYLKDGESFNVQLEKLLN